ncbi:MULTISPECIES: formate--tetrahydrofolate ligase [unclassified Corynebacterium]|uniref:formate--tetrahydrofolate ligase n=1 Tax=unclassified Corynebacterium TaxID=2624378 RepID=UPI0021AA744D|nr:MULTISPECIES: formate--tetrahydrofolate ligase [unclassified Corynebacterium]MCT1452957.1 formate--tetrahydrofolate ligase [Corynebacterium sp. p3-SID1145]MCT1461984.1 formate--tetrahydrofolate ligase [Corynebacterium sp. p3-SID1140]MDN8594730.1 formate--tetrahydrofolate ligase [Corynebacterium sp. P4_F2]WKK56073.1 formate--tetrahydrofolate ligase [Corynebacterium sp. P4-C1]WKK63483.1 formate--tetrahydrofolate ligase [Corynebacterium sp. P8-C1]
MAHPKTDVEIAQAHTLEPVADIAAKAGVPDDALIPYGRSMAKVDVTRLDAPADGKLVLVTGVSPTPAGEGKSTVLIGLTDALAQLGHKAAVALREPSLGPVMGIKGGAAGGGYAQVVPMENINLHFTGDFHAITSANNTLAAMIDNHIQHGNALRIDARRITWQRCLDVNDRSLRNVVTGLGGPGSGLPAETGFTITAASEIMAILGLATDIEDLKRRLAAITVGFTFDKEPVTAGDLHAEGAMAALLKDAVNPNLVQTLGGTPAFIHGGPFANIAHGCNTLIATRTAQQSADIVLTEAGFGSDLGAEKFFDIKARYGDLDIAGAVIVATIRSLKYNGGAAKQELTDENLDALRGGAANLERHVENVRKFGIEPVVALNLFTSDTDAEREFMRGWADDFGVALEEAEVWAKGGDGAVALAEKLLGTLGSGTSKPLYDPAEGTEASIETIAREIYRADDVQYSAAALRDLQTLKDNGWDTLPVCISKTQYSFSDDPSALGAPEGHTLHVQRLLPRTGAGFVVVLTGDVMTMPGLPKVPAANNIDVDADGTMSGLF